MVNVLNEKIYLSFHLVHKAKYYNAANAAS